MKPLTTEAGLEILALWLEDNVRCESNIIFDNDKDRTDSAALLPCVENALFTVKTLSAERHLDTPLLAQRVREQANRGEMIAPADALVLVDAYESGLIAILNQAKSYLDSLNSLKKNP